jgi:hypothetical protein
VNGEKAKSVEVVEGSRTMESGVQQVRNRSGAIGTHANGTHANGTQPSILKGFGSTSNIEQPTATISQAESPQETAKVGGSPNPSHTETGDFNPLVYEFTNKAITCLHGKLDPEETDNIRVISAVRCVRVFLRLLALILAVTGRTGDAEESRLHGGHRARHPRYMQLLCNGGSQKYVPELLHTVGHLKTYSDICK